MRLYLVASVREHSERTIATIQIGMHLHLLQDLHRHMLQTRLVRRMCLETCHSLAMEVNSCYRREWIVVFLPRWVSLYSTTPADRVQRSCMQKQMELP